MIDSYGNLPLKIENYLEWEKKIFAVHSKRKYRFKDGAWLLSFATFWLIFSFFMMFAFIWPLFTTWEVTFTTNGVETIASFDNLKPLIFPVWFMSLFIVIGLFMLWRSIYMMFIKKWSFFIGTDNRFIIFDWKQIRSLYWNQFSWDISMENRWELWDLSLSLLTKKIVKSKNNSRAVPEIIHIVGIKNVLDIEKICRKKIDAEKVNNSIHS